MCSRDYVHTSGLKLHRLGLNGDVCSVVMGSTLGSLLPRPLTQKQDANGGAGYMLRMMRVIIRGTAAAQQMLLPWRPCSCFAASPDVAYIPISKVCWHWSLDDGYYCCTCGFTYDAPLKTLKYWMGAYSVSTVSNHSSCAARISTSNSSSLSLPLHNPLRLKERHGGVLGRVVGGGAAGEALHAEVGSGVEEEREAVAVRAAPVDSKVPRGRHPVVRPLPEELPGVDDNGVRHGRDRDPAAVRCRHAQAPGAVLGEEGEEGRVGVGGDAELVGLQVDGRVPGQPQPEERALECRLEEVFREVQGDGKRWEEAEREGFHGCSVLEDLKQRVYCAFCMRGEGAVVSRALSLRGTEWSLRPSVQSSI